MHLFENRCIGFSKETLHYMKQNTKMISLSLLTAMFQKEFKH